MKAFPTLFAVASLGILGGCSHSAITPDTANPAMPEAWSRGGDQGSVNVDWVRSFNDPQMVSLIEEAVAGNYELQQERARLYQAEQTVRITRADRFPSLDVSLGGSRRGGDAPTTETYDAAIGGRWNVDLWGRLSKEQKAAQLSFAAQRARFESAERDLAARTAASMFAVMEAKQLLAVAEQRLKNVTESHDIVASGYRQGLNDALDLYLARNTVERQQASYAQQQQAYLESVANLQLALARYPDGDMDIRGALPVLDDPISSGLPSELLTRRADLQEAWLNLLAADADLAAAHKARFPSLSLVGSTGITSTDFSDLLDGGTSGWSIAADLVQPLFNAGRLKALEEQALARVQIAEQQYLSLVYRAFAEVENAISRSKSLRQRYESFLEAETNSRAALELALEQYQRGLISYTTVLQSQQQAFDAEATVVQLRSQLAQNRIALYLALGGEFSTGS